LKLIPPRPTFAMDMNAVESTLMQHLEYTRAHCQPGKVLVYGPVMAAEGSFGMGVLYVADEAEARSLIEKDPTVKRKLNRYEISPMFIDGAQGRRG
jgi:uncharacterized protein YciI